MFGGAGGLPGSILLLWRQINECFYETKATLHWKQLQGH